MSLHKEKYQQIILYLCQELDGEVRGKKKLAKLLYFVDFDFFEKNQKESMTGDIYRALPMGPVPNAFQSIAAEMADKKLLDIEDVKERDGYIPTRVYHSLVEYNDAAFTPEERETLGRVIIKYGHLNGRELEELSHAEAPYVATELTKKIAYELAFYRGTDFQDL